MLNVFYLHLKQVIWLALLLSEILFPALWLATPTNVAKRDYLRTETRHLVVKKKQQWRMPVEVTFVQLYQIEGAGRAWLYLQFYPWHGWPVLAPGCLQSYVLRASYTSLTPGMQACFIYFPRCFKLPCYSDGTVLFWHALIYVISAPRIMLSPNILSGGGPVYAPVHAHL